MEVYFSKTNSMTLSDWKNKGAYLAYNSQRIFYVDEGRGEVILLIHGFPTASWDWWKIWNSLTEKYRVLALDLIGFGFSAKPAQYAYTISDQADLVEHFLQKKQITHVKILCHDYGNTVVQELLARFQDRLREGTPDLILENICFLNGGLFPETHRPLFIQKILMSPLGYLVAQLFTQKKLEKNFSQIFGPDTQATPEELDNFWELISGNGGKQVFHLLIRYMQERKDNRARWVGAIQQAQIPIRLIDGTHDPISGQNLIDRYREIIPQPDLIPLENIGHYPQVEAPERVLKHYLEFLG